MDRLLDAATTGPVFLSQPEIANLVVEAIRYGEQTLGHYRLHAYAVMPNHVHVLATPHVTVSKVMQSLKRYTAVEANRILSRVGEPFWQPESYDRLVRNDDEFVRISRYVELNPVRAGLAPVPEDFLWSSAGRREGPVGNRPRVANPPH